MARAIAALLLLTLPACTTTITPTDSACAMSAADRAWLGAALEQWRKAETGDLGLALRPLPNVVAVDRACTYLLPQGGFAGMTAQPHGETAVMPDGHDVPIGPISFASGEGGYFAMSLPSVWREAGVDPGPFGLETLMTGVLLHEMMHIRQVAVAAQARPERRSGPASPTTS